MNRWTFDAVQPLIDAEMPDGMVDLWDAVPAGHVTSTEALEAIGAANQRAILAGLGAVQQKALLAAGMAVGFRPEVFDRIKDLPGVDVAAEILKMAWERDFDIVRLAGAAKGLAETILDEANIGMQATAAVADALGAVAVIVQVVWGAIDLVVTNVRADHEHAKEWQLATLDCVPLAFSARLDKALTDGAVRLLTNQNWEDLFLPAVRPFSSDGDFLGFTCCATTTNRGRMIAPVGLGAGNRWQSSVGATPSPGMSPVPPETYGIDNARGYGCLPMCQALPVHRAIIVPGAGAGTGGPYSGTYDPARALPQLGGLGVYVWRMLWAGGPSAFCVDGNKVADAWREYLSWMRRYIGFNEKRPLGSPELREGWGEGIPNADRACDFWPENDRQRALEWFYGEIGVNKRWANPEGIYTFEDAPPVAQWRQFAKYQAALLERPVVAYVDADTCHPAWRDRVFAAQVALFEHPRAVCDLDVASIPNAAFRAAVVDRRQALGFTCSSPRDVLAPDIAVSPSEGPSLDPLRGDAPPLPELPKPVIPKARVALPSANSKKKASRRRSGRKAVAVAGGAAAFVGLLSLLRR